MHGLLYPLLRCSLSIIKDVESTYLYTVHYFIIVIVLHWAVTFSEHFCFIHSCIPSLIKHSRFYISKHLDRNKRRQSTILQWITFLHDRNVSVCQWSKPDIVLEDFFTLPLKLNHVWKPILFPREVHGWIGIYNQCHFCLILLCCSHPPLFSFFFTVEWSWFIGPAFLFCGSGTLPVVVVTIKTNHFNFLVSYFVHLL